MPKLVTKLPTLYQSFFPRFIDLEFPEEKLATCDNCNLCQSPQSPYINTKCCNYYPHFANYLVGGILQDTRSAMKEGQKRVRTLINSKSGVTPYGIIPPNWYKEATKKKEINEKNRRLTTQENDELLCPYFDHGNCTVWDYRENLCSTYFCNSVGGKSGKNFWKKTNEYLKMAENSLSLHALHQLGFPAAHPKTVHIEHRNFEDDVFETDKYVELWQKWAGKEEQFYIASYELIATLDEAKFRSICGYKHDILEDGITELLTKFKNNLIPDVLVFNPDTKVEQLNAAEIRLCVGDNKMIVSPIIYAHIQKLDGKTTTKDLIDLGFKLVINLEKIIDELRAKNIINEMTVN